MPQIQPDTTAEIHALSQLALSPANSRDSLAFVAGLTAEQRAHFVSLADSNHVLMRAVNMVAQTATNDPDLTQWANGVLRKEDARIQNALTFLQRICEELEAAGCPTAVMESLDHWPDLGNNLCLYTTASKRRVRDVMLSKMGAQVEARSLGDRLANKINFAVPGLPESVEVHAQRLGQTGEHRAMARRFVARRIPKTVSQMTFLVPAPEERIVVSTLQRMYRHFYFRICDIVNTAALLESGQVDFAELKISADIGGIWPGVATYLKIVSDYVKQYRGTGLDLPQEVLESARFGGDVIFVRGKFLRVPIVPNGADLYTRQVTNTAMRGDVEATLRLSLLPYLASAAAVAYRVTGSDKGIW